MSAVILKFVPSEKVKAGKLEAQLVEELREVFGESSSGATPLSLIDGMFGDSQLPMDDAPIDEKE